MDWAHEQTVEGYRLGVVTNHPQTYTVARRADVIMFEPSAFREVHFRSRRIAARLLSGHKIMSLHMGLNEAEHVVRWKELEPEQIVETVRGVIDHQLLWSLRWGAFPSRDVCGIKKVHDWAPMMIDLLRQGWRPVSATRATNGSGARGTAKGPIRPLR